LDISSRISSEVLATKGDHLVLVRSRVEVADGSSGPSEIELLSITRSTAKEGAWHWCASHPEDLEAAYAELDARHAAGEAAAHSA
jgi:hypothetical protein